MKKLIVLIVTFFALAVPSAYAVAPPVNEDPGAGGIPPEFSDCHGYEDVSLYVWGHRIWCSTISHVWIYMW